MIVKVQKPLEGDMTRVLVYNRDRSYSQLHGYDETLRDIFETTGRLKFYAHAELENGNLTIYKIVEDRDW